MILHSKSLMPNTKRISWCCLILAFGFIFDSWKMLGCFMPYILDLSLWQSYRVLGRSDQANQTGIAERSTIQQKLVKKAMEKLNVESALALPLIPEHILNNIWNLKDVSEDDFNKFLSCQDSPSDNLIEQAEKLVEYLSQEQLDISKRIEKLQLKLTRVYRRESDECRRSQAAEKKEKLDRLQLAFDKLSFANNAYYDRPIKSCLLEDEVDFNNLRFRLLHGSKSLAEEKRLLRKAKRRQEPGVMGSCLTLKELNKQISELISESYSSISIDEVEHREIIEELGQLKCTREKAIANAVVNGRIWNSLGSKQTLQEQIREAKIQLTSFLDWIRERNLSMRGNTQEENREALWIDSCSLKEQLREANQRKSRANKWILELRKQQHEMMQAAPSII